MTRKRLTIIIAGGGQIGLLTTQRLNNQGHEVVIIEEDPERCRMLTNEYIATVIEGDATQPQVLEQAEPHMCDVVAALTGNVRTNLTVCTLAKELANIRTVLRSGAEDTTPDAFEGVDAVVHPESFGAAAALNTILSDEVRAVTDTTGEVSLYEVRVSDRAAIAGKQLRNVSLPVGSRIVADVTNGTVISADSMIKAGRTYLIAVEPNQAEEAVIGAGALEPFVPVAVGVFLPTVRLGLSGSARGDVRLPACGCWRREPRIVRLAFYRLPV